MKCMVSGGTGFIGRRVVDRLLERGHDVGVWSRTDAGQNLWDPLSAEPLEASLQGVDAVIHLAGEAVAQRWNHAVKTRIRDSRVAGTRRLVDAIARLRQMPRVLVSASAVGIYGDRGDEVLIEASAPGGGFLADVCRGWEAEAALASELGVRVVRLRIGVVLGRGGGAMAKILPAFRLCAGGRLGSGEQWMPWIHVDDVTEMVVRAAEEQSVTGVWNAASPNPVRNVDFTRELASSIHRPAIIPVPEFALKIAFGELGKHMLDSARVLPESPLQAGFRFRYPELGAALRDLVD